MAEVELDLLERPLHEKTGERVRDRPQPSQRQPAGDPDQQLLADPDVDHTAGVAGGGGRELRCGDVREHDRDARIAVQQSVALATKRSRMDSIAISQCLPGGGGTPDRGETVPVLASG